MKVLFVAGMTLLVVVGWYGMAFTYYVLSSPIAVPLSLTLVAAAAATAVVYALPKSNSSKKRVTTYADPTLRREP